MPLSPSPWICACSLHCRVCRQRTSAAFYSLHAVTSTRKLRCYSMHLAFGHACVHTSSLKNAHHKLQAVRWMQALETSQITTCPVPVLSMHTCRWIGRSLGCVLVILPRYFSIHLKVMIGNHRKPLLKYGSNNNNFFFLFTAAKMSEQAMLPSPNWFLTTVAACSSDGTLAYGSRNGIVVITSIKEKEGSSSTLDFETIPNAHREKVIAMSFSSRNLPDSGLPPFPLASASEDGMVIIWNLESLEILQRHREHVSIKYVSVSFKGLFFSLKLKNNEALLESWRYIVDT